MNSRPRAVTHEEAMAVAVTASALAGHDVAPEALDMLHRIGRGDLTYDEAAAEIIAQFGQPAD